MRLRAMPGPMELGARSLLRRSFGPLVAVVYTGSTLAHVVRLVVRFSFEDMPFFPDWGVVLLGTPGVIGLVAYAREVDYRGAWEKIVHWLTVVHLGVSVLLHAWILLVRSHEMLSVFSLEYSYFALGYFGFFAWRSWTMRMKPVWSSEERIADAATDPGRHHR